jgi:hypothetical protein
MKLKDESHPLLKLRGHAVLAAHICPPTPVPSTSDVAALHDTDPHLSATDAALDDPESQKLQLADTPTLRVVQPVAQ